MENEHTYGANILVKFSSSYFSMSFVRVQTGEEEFLIQNLRSTVWHNL